MSDVWEALANPARRQILKLLRNGSKTAGEISAEFSMTKPSISNHLAILKQAELIRSDKQGQFVHYTLNTSVVQDILSSLMDLSGKEE